MNSLRPLAICVLFAALESLHVGAQQQVYDGCYDLDIEAWSDGSANPDSTWWATRIRLSSTPGRGLFDSEYESSVRVVPGAMPDIHPFAWWRALDSAGLEIVWSNGFTGFDVVLDGQPGEALRGVAKTFTDEIPSTAQTANATASPVDCDARIEPARQLYHRYPRSVALMAGDSVMLDDSLRMPLVTDSIPSRMPRPGVVVVRYRRFVLNGEPAGPFAGADRVEVTVGADRRINSIEMWYPDTVSFEVLLRRLSAELGPPRSSDLGHEKLAGWWSRTSSITLHDDSRATVATRVTLSVSY